MNYQEIIGKSVDELNSILLDSKKKLYNLRFQILSGEAANPAEIRKNRKIVAKVKTALKEKSNA